MKLLKLLATISIFAMPIAGIANDCSHLSVSAGTMEWEPISFRRESQDGFYGLAYDVVNEVARNLNLKLDVKEMPFKRLLLLLEAGQLDMGLALYKTREREKKYLYSKPYFRNEARVFVKKGREFKFERLEDLVGWNGVAPAGGSFGQRFDSFAKLRLNIYRVHKEPFKDTYHRLILQERKDFFLADYWDGLSSIRKSGLENQIVALDHPVDINEVHFAMGKHSRCIHLLEKIDLVLDHLVQNGAIRQMTEKYRL